MELMVGIILAFVLLIWFGGWVVLWEKEIEGNWFAKLLCSFAWPMGLGILLAELVWEARLRHEAMAHKKDVR